MPPQNTGNTELVNQDTKNTNLIQKPSTSAETALSLEDMQKQYEDFQKNYKDFQEEWDITKKEREKSSPFLKIQLRPEIQDTWNIIQEKWATLQKNTSKESPCDMKLWNSILDDWKKIQGIQKDLKEAVQDTTLVNAIKATSIGAALALGSFFIKFATSFDFDLNTLSKIQCGGILGIVIGTLIGVKYPKMTSYKRKIELLCRNTAAIMSGVLPTSYGFLLLAGIYTYYLTKSYFAQMERMLPPFEELASLARTIREDCNTYELIQ